MVLYFLGAILLVASLVVADGDDLQVDKCIQQLVDRQTFAGKIVPPDAWRLIQLIIFRNKDDYPPKSFIRYSNKDKFNFGITRLLPISVYINDWAGACYRLKETIVNAFVGECPLRLLEDTELLEEKIAGKYDQIDYMIGHHFICQKIHYVDKRRQ